MVRPVVSKWKFWTWPKAFAKLDREIEFFVNVLEEYADRFDPIETEVRQLAAKITKMENARQDHAIRVLALERRFDRLEELIKKEAAVLRLGGNLASVGEDFMRRFMADGQRYLVEYEDLLKKWQP